MGSEWAEVGTWAGAPLNAMRPRAPVTKQEEERLLRKGRRGADARKTDEERAHEFAYQWLHIRKSSI